MAAPTLTPLEITRPGIVPVFVAATAAGDYVVPAAGLVLWVRNGGGASITVSPQPTLVDWLGNPSLPTSVTVPAAGNRFIGPFPRECYVAADQLMRITYSSVASVTVAAVQIGSPTGIDTLLLTEIGEFLLVESGDPILLGV